MIWTICNISWWLICINIFDMATALEKIISKLWTLSWFLELIQSITNTLTQLAFFHWCNIQPYGCMVSTNINQLTYIKQMAPSLIIFNSHIHVATLFCNTIIYNMGFPGGSLGKESACKVGEPGSIPGSGRSPEEGYGNSLKYSCLEKFMDRGAWLATVLGVTKSRTRLEWLTQQYTT